MAKNAMSKISIAAMVVILLVLGFFYLKTSSKDVIPDIDVPIPIKGKLHADRGGAQKTEDRVWKENETKVVEVKDEKTGKQEEVTLQKYTDPNYDLRVSIPDDYSYEVTDTAVIFNSDDRNLFYAAEVLLTEDNGGMLATFGDVRDNYLTQFQNFNPTLVSEKGRNLDGKSGVDFTVRYEIPNRGVYVNRFAVGRDANFFYILQFNTRAVLYENDKPLIEELISGFEYSSS